MTSSDFTTTLLVDENKETVFKAINNVRGWWSENIEGNTDEVNSVFAYHYEDVHRCKMKITEMMPNEKIVWDVLENEFSFTKDTKEWTGTKVIFEITEQDGKTQLRLTHRGLVPEYECYEICKDGWTNYIQNSLRSLITTGKGMPNGKDKPQTVSERKLTEK